MIYKTFYALSFILSISNYVLSFGIVPVSDGETELVEYRKHASLQLEGNSIRATMLAQFWVNDPWKVDRKYAREVRATTLVQDVERATNYIISEYYNLDESIWSYEFKIQIAGREELVVEVDYHVGFTPEGEFEMWAPVEPGKGSDSYWIYNINGRVWEFHVHGYLVKKEIPNLDREVSSLGMLPDEVVIEALNKLGLFLAHDNGGVFLPYVKFCGDIMPSFISERCHHEKMMEPRWEVIEKDCDFDAEFGYPCISGVIDFNQLPKRKSILCSYEGEPSVDEDCEALSHTQMITLQDEPFFCPALENAVSRRLVMRGVRVVATSSGTCSRYLLVKVTADSRDEALKVVTSLAQEIDEIPHTILTVLKAVELEMVSSVFEPLGTLRMTPEMARELVTDETKAELFLSEIGSMWSDETSD